MAKINLITRHSGESYGAVLQTYATCKILESLGHKVTIINLVEKERIKRYFRFSSLFSYPKYINFWLFKMWHYPHRTSLMTKIDVHKIPKSDYTIVGSDQVWNSRITKENKLSYFLNFAHGAKKLSLASSFGKSCWEEDADYTAIVKKCLYDFDAISVRETSGVDICKNVFGLNATCIIDPTIALGDFNSFLHPKPINQIAVFVINRKNPLFKVVASILSEKTGTSVKVLDYYKGSEFESLKTSEKSPVRWMNEIYNSKFVLTDSFHGVAFSLIFRKNFFVICADEKKFTRISSLLKKVGMEGRVITNKEDLYERLDSLLLPMNYEKVEKVFKEERKKYLDFVKSNIHG